MKYAACKLYVGCRRVVFISRSVVERFNCKQPLYSVLPTVCVRTDCVEAEQNTKQNNRTWLQGLHQRIPKLSGRKLAGCCCCFCSVHNTSPLSNINGFWHMQECYGRLLVLQDTFMYNIFSWIIIASLVVSNRRLLLHLRRYTLKY